MLCVFYHNESQDGLSRMPDMDNSQWTSSEHALEGTLCWCVYGVWWGVGSRAEICITQALVAISRTVAFPTSEMDPWGWGSLGRGGS